MVGAPDFQVVLVSERLEGAPRTILDCEDVVIL